MRRDRTAKIKNSVRRQGGPQGQRLPLQSVLIALFVIQATLAAALVGYVSFRSARTTVNDVAHQLRAEVTTRIEERVHSFLETPQLLTEVNARWIGLGVVNPNDPDALERRFWEQIQASPSVSSLYFANTTGGIVDAGREGMGGPLYIIATDGFAAGTFRKFATDDAGSRTTLLQSVPDFDARTRAWYVGAVANGEATWSDIYVLFSGQDMAISASRPVLDTQGRLLGVMSADLFLSQVSDFLRTLRIGKTGLSFIVERSSGLLVASSVDERPIVAAKADQPYRRLLAVESNSPVVRAAAAVLTESPADSRGAFNGQQAEFRVADVQHFLQVATVQDGRGIDWLVVVAIPERDFMAQIDSNTRTTLAFVIAAALIAITFGVLTSRWVTRPVKTLGLSAQALARGEWGEVPVVSRIREMATLSQSFNSMTRRLRQMVRSLETEVADRKRAEEHLRESEARYRLLADNSTDVIWTMDVDGVFTYMSPSIRALRGYTAEEVMQAPLSAALTLDSAAIVAARFDELRTRVANGEHVQERFELEQPCKDGTTVWTETVISAMVDDEGRLLGVLGVSRNITARKRGEQDRLALEAQLRQSQKLESIGTLASGIAHEINNPLTGVINYADLIEQRTEDPQLQEYAHGIITEGNRMADIVRGLLSFARRETSQRTKEQMPDIVRASLTLVGALLKKDQIRLELTVAGDLPAVLCNPQQIEQVIINLLTNARDAVNRKYPGYHEDKRIMVTIRAFEKEGKPWVRTTVEDRGTGVPAGLTARIFDPFFTTKSRAMGTGLGLAISYGIAVEHGGSLTIESEEGVYARLHLDLLAENDENAGPGT